MIDFCLRGKSQSTEGLGCWCAIIQQRSTTQQTRQSVIPSSNQLWNTKITSPHIHFDESQVLLVNLKSLLLNDALGFPVVPDENKTHIGSENDTGI